MKLNELFTVDEFLAAVQDWNESAKGFRPHGNFKDEQHRETCPACALGSVILSSEEACGVYVNLATTCLLAVLTAEDPQEIMMKVVSNCIMIGAVMGKAHAENQALKRML